MNMQPNTPKTAAELQEILRLHKLWLDGDSDGKRADLSYANLSFADLRFANLSYANLSYADLSYADLRFANLSYADLSYADLRFAEGFILAGQDIRGYLFCARQNDNNVVVVRAGCREFVGISKARAHWTARHTGDEILHADCLSLVDRCETMAKVRGWLLEPQTESVSA